MSVRLVAEEETSQASGFDPSRPYDFLLACYSKNYSSKREKKNAFIESIGVIVHRIKEGHLVTLCMS